MPRRKGQDAFSLFAFQDIITSVTGIILLIALILALELVQREEITDTPGQSPVANAPTPATAATAQQVREQIREGEEILAGLASVSVSELEDERERLKKELERLRAEGALPEPDPVVSANQEQLDTILEEIEELEEELESKKSAKKVVYNKDTSVNKEGWVFDVGPDQVWVSRIGQQVDSPPRGFRQLSQAVEWAKQRDKDKEYFVLAVRPQAIKAFEALRDTLQGLGFDLGFDLIGSDYDIIGKAE